MFGDDTVAPWQAASLRDRRACRPAIARIGRARRRRQLATYARIGGSLRRAIATAGLVVALFSLAPVGFGAIAQWQARWFGSQLVAGMSHRRIDDLRKAAGGSAAGRIIDDAPSATHVWFVPFVQPCYIKARVFALRFDRRDRLESWSTDTWGAGC